jgi:hypothetical protein
LLLLAVEAVVAGVLLVGDGAVILILVEVVAVVVEISAASAIPQHSEQKI